MKQLLADAGTVFLVSHAAKTVEEECTRALWMHKGRLVVDGPAYDVAQKYRWWAWNLANGESDKAARLLEDAFAEGQATTIRFDEPPDPRAPARHART